jgi:phospholipid transport system substrate-binding protein
MKRLAILFAVVWLGVPVVSSGAGPVVATSTGPAAADASSEAVPVVESFHAALLGCMEEGDAIGFLGRYERMLAALDDAFDLQFMARTALGSTWRDLPGDQQAEFIDQFRRLSASTYADNFSSYEGEHFETLAEQSTAHGTLVVKTEFVQPSGRNVRFSYLMRKVGDEWRVIDVLLDGKISELALRRGQYRASVESEGFPVLVETLESRIDELASP